MNLNSVYGFVLSILVTSALANDRASVPADTIQKEQQAQLTDILGRPLHPTDQESDEKAIDQLGGMIETVGDDPNGLFVVLSTMRDLSIASADIDHAIQASNILVERFSVDNAQIVASTVRSLTSQSKDERSLSLLVQYLHDAYDKKRLSRRMLCLCYQG